MSKLIIIDNYDSFTYNLVHFLEPQFREIIIFRNDEINYDQISENHKILLSPGPGLPSDNKELNKVIDRFHLSNNIFGVCLGFQALGQYFGAELENLRNVRHGIQSKIKVLDHQFLFKNIPNNFNIGHYHSWVIKNIPSNIKVTAKDFEDYAMAFRHKDLKISGIQFHPESILTEYGKQILLNWINN